MDSFQVYEFLLTSVLVAAPFAFIIALLFSKK